MLKMFLVEKHKYSFQYNTNKLTQVLYVKLHFTKFALIFLSTEIIGLSLRRIYFQFFIQVYKSPCIVNIENICDDLY